MKKNIITVLVIIGALVIIAFTLLNNKKENQAKIDIVAQKNASVSVKIDTVKTENIALNFSVNGSFEPIQELSFTAERSGKIIQVLVKEGDAVRIGQTLAILRSDAVNVSAQTANASYQNALTDYNRYENAYKTGGVTKQQLDQAKMQLVNAKANLSQANISLGDTQIKATINGIVNKRFVEPGSYVSATPATTLFEIVNVSKLKLKVNVNEKQVADLKIGTTTIVTSSVYPDKTFSGKITFIAPKADSSLNFPVEVEITNNASNDLKAGMYGTAEFTPKQQKQNLMIIPRIAFVGSVNSNQVFVINNGIAILKTVTAGRILGDKVEILKGLSNGEVVITTGQINLQDGNTVDIIK